MIDEERLLEEMGRRRDNLQFALEMASGEKDYTAVLSLYKSLIEHHVLFEVYMRYAENPNITEEQKKAVRMTRGVCSKIEENILRELSQPKIR